MKRIQSGQTVNWQRHRASNAYSGEVLAFCPKGTAISEAIDLSKYRSGELRRVDPERNSMDRYLVYVKNVGVVSISAATIEKQNPNLLN